MMTGCRFFFSQYFYDPLSLLSSLANFGQCSVKLKWFVSAAEEYSSNVFLVLAVVVVVVAAAAVISVVVIVVVYFP